MTPVTVNMTPVKLIKPPDVVIMTPVTVNMTPATVIVTPFMCKIQAWGAHERGEKIINRICFFDRDLEMNKIFQLSLIYNKIN